ncbi:MAG: HAMP domain-containing histidine kinase [Lachnospiraceae bacterium]|nr:HAMP domain-containing histidine kinase [Lachnospiraceae bacterium]
MRLRARLFRAFLFIILVPSVAVWVTSYLLGKGSPDGEAVLSRGTDFWMVTMVALFVLIATVGLVILWINKSVLRPIRELQKATHEIGNGNLDYELEQVRDDEIGDLCDDFETMRRKLQQSEQERRAADNEVRTVISNISHDLRTPVTAVKGYAQGIMDGIASSPEKLDKYVRTIYNKASDMEKLVDELSLFSKIDTNKIVYHFEKVDIENWLREYAENIRLDLESGNIDLNFSSTLTAPVTVIADKEHIKRVLDNIITNSVKYIDKSRGIIDIRIRDAEETVQLEVEDNGCGIPRQDLPFIFDRFYRTDTSRRSTTGGSGIGLSIARKIVDDHGGRIWATSTEGVGTIMHIVLRKYRE